MKNFLKKFEEDNTQFFVMKSYVFAAFESERKKEEYHIFFIKKNSNPDAYYKGYVNLKERRMNSMEIEYFKKVVDEKYSVEMWNNDGKIYNLKSKPFDRSQCPPYRQYILNL